MGLFSFLSGKTRKTNLTPSEDFKNQQDLYFTDDAARSGGYNLRDIAANKMKGIGTGFGDDFTSRMSSPGIAQIDANFKDRTLPTLSNEASKRGLSRSSIVQDQIGQADLQRNRDVDEMVAKFQYLNEQQKKSDETQGINLASGLQDQQRSMLDNKALASERQVGRNVAGDQYKDASEAKAGGQILQAVSSLVSGMPMSSGGGGTGFNPFSMSTPPTGYQLPFKSSTMGGSSGVKTLLLGSSGTDFESWLNSLFG